MNEGAGLDSAAVWHLTLKYIIIQRDGYCKLLEQNPWPLLTKMKYFPVIEMKWCEIVASCYYVVQQCFVMMFVCAATFSTADVLVLAKALKQLSGSSHSSLTHLSVSTLPDTELMDILLDASHSLTSFSVEFNTCSWFSPLRPSLSEMSGMVKLSNTQWAGLKVFSTYWNTRFF